MSIYKNIDNEELAEAISFFPGLNSVSEVKDKLTPAISEKIKKRSTEIWNEAKGEILSQLIDKYFNLSAYESLNKLESKEWGIQLFIRNKILADLKNPEKPREGLQRGIYELINRPILSHTDYPLTFHPYDSTINDLTVVEAYRISDKCISNGSFKVIEESPGNEDSLTHDQQDLQDIFDLCVSSVGNMLAEDDTPTVATTIDLNASDDQLKDDFARYIAAKKEELCIKKTKPKKFKPGRFSPLINHKIIPYIDLKILDIYVNGKATLKHHQVADYLFPVSGPKNDKDTTEVIRKSTIKYADEMLNEKIIRSLLISAGKLPFEPIN